MRVGLCDDAKVEGLIARTIGLEGLEGYKQVKWIGGIDVILKNKEELEEFLAKYGEYVYAVGREEMEEVVGRLLKEREAQGKSFAQILAEEFEKQKGRK